MGSPPGFISGTVARGTPHPGLHFSRNGPRCADHAPGARVWMVTLIYSPVTRTLGPVLFPERLRTSKRHGHPVPGPCCGVHWGPAVTRKLGLGPFFQTPCSKKSLCQNGPLKVQKLDATAKVHVAGRTGCHATAHDMGRFAVLLSTMQIRNLGISAGG